MDEGDENNEELGSDVQEAGKSSQSKSGGLSEYGRTREKNMKELKAMMADLKAQYPMPDKFGPEPAPSKTVSNKPELKKVDQAVVRRESQRNKDKRQM